MLENVIVRTFTGEHSCLAGFFIGFYEIDYHVGIFDSKGKLGAITIRGGGGGGFFDGFPKIKSHLKNFVYGEGAHISPNQLPSTEIVLFHEHEQQDQKQSRLIFRSGGVNGTTIITARFVQWVEGVLSQDFITTLLDPHQTFQESIFPHVNDPLPLDAVFLSQNDLGQVAFVLSEIHKIQKKYYQASVDHLLSILPPP